MSGRDTNAIFFVFPKPLSRSCFGSGVARTQTCASRDIESQVVDLPGMPQCWPQNSDYLNKDYGNQNDQIWLISN